MAGNRQWRVCVLSLSLIAASAFLAYRLSGHSDPYDHLFVEFSGDLGTYTGPERVNGLPGELLWRANKGRMVTDDEGKFVFPETVKRVWIDVGANMLQKTRAELFTSESLGVIAVEPLPDCWNSWPDVDRLVAIPLALDENEGTAIFHVASNNLWSSLSESLPGRYESESRTVREFPVEVLRLERIMQMIPEHLPIELLKVDVQGKDLEVLKSAGNHLRRVQLLDVEVVIDAIYEGDGGDSIAPKERFDSYLARYGFVSTNTIGYAVFGEKTYLDVTYQNKTGAAMAQ
ncbi:MAG: FkbM family methyltransferase [Bdellovibrionales bacterium]|nr:FkbM family methyltransferase [Bdellovibrionales bacterium]